MIDAIITKVDGKYEVRCGICGKLLFVIKEFSEKDVDLSKPNVIIVARCTRNCCKTDNQISIPDTFKTIL